MASSDEDLDVSDSYLREDSCKKSKNLKPNTSDEETVSESWQDIHPHKPRSRTLKEKSEDLKLNHKRRSTSADKDSRQHVKSESVTDKSEDGTDVVKLKWQITLQKKKIKHLVEQVDDLEKDLEASEENAQEERKKSRKNTKDWKAKVTKIQSEKETAEDEVDSLKSEIFELKRKIKLKTDSADEISQLRMKLDVVEKENEEIIKERNELKAKVADLMSEKDQLRILREENQRLKSQEEAHEQDLEKQRTMLKSGRAEKDNIQKKFDKANLQQQALYGKLKKQDPIGTAVNTVDNLSARCLDLSNFIGQYATFFEENEEVDRGKLNTLLRYVNEASDLFKKDQLQLKKYSRTISDIGEQMQEIWDLREDRTIGGAVNNQIRGDIGIRPNIYEDDKANQIRGGIIRPNIYEDDMAYSIRRGDVESSKPRREGYGRDEDADGLQERYVRNSTDKKCPICHKMYPVERIEAHSAQCTAFID